MKLYKIVIIPLSALILTIRASAQTPPQKKNPPRLALFLMETSGHKKLPKLKAIRKKKPSPVMVKSRSDRRHCCCCYCHWCPMSPPLFPHAPVLFFFLSVGTLPRFAGSFLQLEEPRRWGGSKVVVVVVTVTSRTVRT